MKLQLRASPPPRPYSCTSTCTCYRYRYASIPAHININYRAPFHRPLGLYRHLSSRDISIMSSATSKSSVSSSSTSTSSSSASSSPLSSKKYELNNFGTTLIATRLQEFVAPTVWHEFTPLAAATKAVNLGQGFPGWNPPAFVSDAAVTAVTSNHRAPEDFLLSQYARSAGHLPLCQTLAQYYSQSSRLNHSINPLTDVVITVGASEALCAFMLGALNPDDEIVMLEPAFDIYIAQARMCGATIKFVPLRTRAKQNGAVMNGQYASSSSSSSSSSVQELEWYVDMKELRSAFTSKTKCFLLNTPHNPTGKVFTRTELLEIGEILKEFDTMLLSDEVYEHMTYDPHHAHISPASLHEDLYQRTITCSSAGKTFSVTGWKIGWLIGPQHLTSLAAIAHQWLSFSTCTPLQEAVHHMLIKAQQPYEKYSTYFHSLAADYLRRRTIVMNALKQAGLNPIEPEGGFFIMADTSAVILPEPYASDESVTRDWNFCRWLCKEIGVCAIPPSAFCCDEDKHLVKNMARFAFCKPDHVLHEGAKRLLKVKEFIGI